jgi:multicomponent Na+:H+ antiporter subunit B
MISLILRTALRALMPLMLMFSIFLLLRGHHQPGGGFAGGLMAAAAFALYLLAHDAASARQILRVSPQTVIGGGLLLAGATGALSWLKKEAFLSAGWAHFKIGSLDLALGTPMLFDVGVYLVAFGAAVLMILSLWEQ